MLDDKITYSQKTEGTPKRELIKKPDSTNSYQATPYKMTRRFFGDFL
jgi:hypothetical protein